MFIVLIVNTCLTTVHVFMKKASQKHTHQTRLPPTDVIEEPQLVDVNDTHSVSEAETLSIKADPLIGFVPHFVST